LVSVENQKVIKGKRHLKGEEATITGELLDVVCTRQRGSVEKWGGEGKMGLCLFATDQPENLASSRVDGKGSGQGRGEEGRTGGIEVSPERPDRGCCRGQRDVVSPSRDKAKRTGVEKKGKRPFLIGGEGPV